MIRSAVEPHQYVRKLVEPIRSSIFGIPFVIEEHFFCEGLGESAKAIDEEVAYQFWLRKFENPWWKRLFGAPRHRIPTVEVPDPSPYKD